MPYIKQSERDELDSLIDATVARIKLLSAHGAHGTPEPDTEYAGRLNYVVTRMVINLMGPPKYWKIALYCGVLANIASEFYRKLAIPYEDKKIAENGDVYPRE